MPLPLIRPFGAPSPRSRGEGQDGRRLRPPSPRLRGEGWVWGKATNSAFSEKKGDDFRKFPNKINVTTFFIPAHFHALTLVPVPPSDTPDDAMSGEAGPAPGARVVADLNPRPAATVSLRTWGW